MKGAFFVLEGFEGAGKTTRAEELAKRLNSQGIRTETVREPGGDPFAEKLRVVLKETPDDVIIHPWAEALLFCSARFNMLESVVKPLLAEGVVVVSDRNFVSTMAYQGWGSHLKLPEVQMLRNVCHVAIRPAVPDKIILLDVTMETAKQRMADRRGEADRFERRGEDFFQRVINGYREEARYGGYPLVDANQSIDAVDAAIWKHVVPVLREKGLL